MSKISYRITDSRVVPAAHPSRRGMEDMIIVWLEDGARPYQTFIPAEDYTPDKGIAAVEAEVDKHALIIGHEGSRGS